MGMGMGMILMVKVVASDNSSDIDSNSMILTAIHDTKFSIFIPLY